MNLEDKNFEDKDMDEEYEMVPFEPMMYGCAQMNAMPTMGMNQGMGMNPNMAMNPSMEMNSYMGINGFDQGMFMNGFDSMEIMDEEESRKDYNDEDEHEMLRPMDKQGYNQPFKDGYKKPNKYNTKYNDVYAILRRIERYNPGVFRSLIRCGMPYEEAKNVIRRIVKLTLMYSEQ